MIGSFFALLLEHGLGLLAGGWLLYVGYLSPFVGRRIEAENRDRVLTRFRLFAKFAGPLICCWVGWQLYVEIRATSQLVNHLLKLEWYEFACAEGRFRVSFPKDPAFPKGHSTTSAEVPFADGRVTEHRFQTSVPELLVVKVMYRDIPDSMPKFDPQRLLEDDLDTWVKRAKVRLMSRESTQFCGRTAIRYKLEDPKQYLFVEGISLIAGRRIYLIATQFVSDGITAVDRERFFNSFQIIEAK